MPLQQGFLAFPLRCTTPKEGKKILAEINKGGCGSYIEGRSLAEKALRMLYYCPHFG